LEGEKRDAADFVALMDDLRKIHDSRDFGDEKPLGTFQLERIFQKLCFGRIVNQVVSNVFFGKKRVPETAILEIVTKKLLTSYQDVMLVYPDGVDYDEDSPLFR
jgi:hypothetical protein